MDIIKKWSDFSKENYHVVDNSNCGFDDSDDIYLDLWRLSRIILIFYKKMIENTL